MTVKAIQSYEEFAQLINSNQVVVIDFWATWCGPCRVISPVFEKLSNAAEFSDITFYKVDVDDQEEIAAAAGIRAMPTFIVFQGGKKVKQVVGSNPAALQNLLREAATLAPAQPQL